MVCVELAAADVVVCLVAHMMLAARMMLCLHNPAIMCHSLHNALARSWHRPCFSAHRSTTPLWPDTPALPPTPQALCDLAYVAPSSVLPLVVQRFREALDSGVAPHQLVTSITTLAMCVRPLLLAGWTLPEEGTAQVGSSRHVLRAACPVCALRVPCCWEHPHSVLL